MKNVLKFAMFLTGIVLVALNVPAFAHVVEPTGLSFLAKHSTGITLAYMGVGVVDVTRARAAYENLKEVAAKLNLVFTDASIIVNEDYFLSELPISNNTQQYQFPTWDKVMQTLVNYPLLQGVKDNDIFVGISAQLYLDYRKVGNTNVYPQTYVNATHFAGSGATVTDLQSFFNAQLSIQVGRTVYIPNLNTRRFLLVPDTQQSLAGNQSGFHGANLVDLDPYPLFSGRADNKLIVDVPTYSGWAPAATTSGYENVVSIQMHGITLQNAEKYMDYFSGGADIDAEIAKLQSQGKLKDVNGIWQRV